MAQQAVKYDNSWTIRAPGETTQQFVDRVPAGQSAPDGGECDGGFTEWESGGVHVEVCTKCNDTPQGACEELHSTTVAALKQRFPEDP